MISSIIGAIVVGLIIGALARLFTPGKQNISLLITIVIGVVSSLIVNFILGAVFGYDGGAGVSWWYWIVSIVVAALIIRVYASSTSKKV